MIRVRAFTVIELLTSLTIVSLLCAVLLPAVHHARESARRTRCQNNLRQIGLAMHSYESALNVFPPGSVPAGWAWTTMLLPQLEQGARYALIDFNNNIDPVSGCYSYMPESRRLRAIQPGYDFDTQVFQCPSDPQQTGPYTGYRGVAGNQGFVVISEPFCPGSPFPEKENGMLSFCSSVRAADVRDGQSQTLLVGEIGFPASMLGGSDVGQAHSWMSTLGGLRPGVYDDSLTSHFWSFHPNGAQFLFVDGHVRLLNYSLDNHLFQALGSRSGREVVSDF